MPPLRGVGLCVEIALCEENTLGALSGRVGSQAVLLGGWVLGAGPGSVCLSVDSLHYPPLPSNCLHLKQQPPPDRVSRGPLHSLLDSPICMPMPGQTVIFAQ